MLQRGVELDLQVVHRVPERPDLHEDASPPPRHHRHRARDVGDRADVGRERALAHLRRFDADFLAELLDGARLTGAVGLELGDQMLEPTRRPLEVLDLFHLSDLIGRELGTHGSPSVSTRPSSGSAGVRSSSRANVGAMSTVRTLVPYTPRLTPAPQKSNGTCASKSDG